MVSFCQCVCLSDKLLGQSGPCYKVQARFKRRISAMFIDLSSTKSSRNASVASNVRFVSFAIHLFKMTDHEKRRFMILKNIVSEKEAHSSPTGTNSVSGHVVNWNGHSRILRLKLYRSFARRSTKPAQLSAQIQQLLQTSIFCCVWFKYMYWGFIWIRHTAEIWHLKLAQVINVYLSTREIKWPSKM